jgi:hypothetical protein
VSITISNPTTAARTSATNITMAHQTDATVRMRGTGPKIYDMKIVGFDGISPGVEVPGIYIRNTGLGSPACTQFHIKDVHVEAVGESAITCDYAAGVGNGTIEDCLIDGKTFTGSQPAQITAFGTAVISSTILSPLGNQIQIPVSHIGNVVVGSPISALANVVASATTVSAIDSVTGILTLNKALLGGADTTVNLSFNATNGTQYTVPNCARQLVVIQSVNQPVHFKNNVVKGVTGGGISYNTGVTVDAPNSIVTGNLIKGIHGTAYALRARFASYATNVTDNTNYSLPGKTNLGYLLGASGDQVSGLNIDTNISIEQGLIAPVQESASAPLLVAMDLTQLLDLSIVSSDPVFSNEENWSLVTYVFKHDGSSRRLISSFKDPSESKELKLKTGMQSGDLFQLVKIIISKPDRTLFVIRRTAIEGVSDYDFVLK